MVEKRESRGCKDWPAGAEGGVRAMSTARWAPRLTGDTVHARQPMDRLLLSRAMRARASCFSVQSIYQEP